MSLRNYLKGIADKLRENLHIPDTETINAQDFPNKIEEVYNIGYDEGHEEGYHQGEAVGFEQGKQAEYDRFWDKFQQNGKRIAYAYAFAYGGWTDEVYNPKYTIKPISCNNLFTATENITDTKVDIDLTDLGGTQKYYIFNSARKLKTVKKLIVHEAWATTGCFDTCVALENIVIEGTLGRSINMQWSALLTAESTKSVVTHLKDYKGTEYEGTYTVKFHDTAWNTLEATTPPDGYTSWKDYVLNKGWLI